jgi:hypothetical protein
MLSTLADGLQPDKEIDPLWQPLPGPQSEAFNCQATVIGYGGQAGGGKTDLGLGLAATQHNRSVIFRRTFPQLRSIIERSREIFNPANREAGKDRYNESLHRWVLTDGRIIEFESCQYEKDREKQRGRPRDLYVFDEATEFARSMIEFITAWLRSTDPNQKTTILLTFNPPTDEDGMWVVDYFRPWFSYLYPDQFQHDNPAAPGEIRYFATVAGEQVECESGEPFEYEDETITPTSRTFIPASLDDNPYLSQTNYRSILQSLPEPLRSQLLHGDFALSQQTNPYQVIPTAWVKLAQKRWMEMERPSTPLSGVGVDLVRGGQDNMAIAKRYGNWFDEVIKVPGINVADGPAAAALLYNALRDDKHVGYINMDVIGIGSSGYDSTRPLFPTVLPVNASEKSNYVAMSNAKPPQELFKMRNVRAEYHWRMREALDPESGMNLALPPGNEIVADLCAARYQMMADRVIQIEPKDEIKKRIGRSPDVGEAIMMALHQAYGYQEKKKVAGIL